MLTSKGGVSVVSRFYMFTLIPIFHLDFYLPLGVVGGVMKGPQPRRTLVLDPTVEERKVVEKVYCTSRPFTGQFGDRRVRPSRLQSNRYYIERIKQGDNTKTYLKERTWWRIDFLSMVPLWTTTVCFFFYTKVSHLRRGYKERGARVSILSSPQKQRGRKKKTPTVIKRGKTV